MKLIPPNYWTKRGEMELTVDGQKIPFATAWAHSLLSDFGVLTSLSTLKDGSQWIHISVSRSDRIPTWEEFIKVKNDFLGENKEAYQVLPARIDYVNACKNALHMWAPVDGVRRVANLMDLTKEEPC